MVFTSSDDFGIWVKNVFEPASDEDYWPQEPPRVTVAYLTTLFLNATQILQPYSNQQVAQGLSWIASNNYSDTMYALLDESVPRSERQKCIRAMYTLYKDFFTHRCSPELSFPPERFLDNPINFVSGHWFDLFPFHGRSDLTDAGNQEFLNVFRKLLAFDSEICHEGALSGLGAWHCEFRKEVGQILDEYLLNNPQMNPQLREHAALARIGLNTL